MAEDHLPTEAPSTVHNSRAVTRELATTDRFGTDSSQPLVANRAGTTYGGWPIRGSGALLTYLSPG